MTFRPFELILDETAFADMGVTKTEVDVGVVVLNATCESGDVLRLTASVLERSVGVRWTRDGDLVLEMARDGATELRVTDFGKQIVFRTSFTTDDLSGELVIDVGERVSVRDTLLFG